MVKSKLKSLKITKSILLDLNMVNFFVRTITQAVDNCDNKNMTPAKLHMNTGTT